MDFVYIAGAVALWALTALMVAGFVRLAGEKGGAQ